jgi:hypothetical protein
LEDNPETQPSHIKGWEGDPDESAREIPSRRGEIIAIATIIGLGFIRFIIIVITRTIITSPSHYNIFG